LQVQYHDHVLPPAVRAALKLSGTR